MINLPWAKDSKRISNKRYNEKIQRERQAFKRWIKKEVKSEIRSAEKRGHTSTCIYCSWYYNNEFLDIVNNMESELIKHGYKVEHDPIYYRLEISWEE